MIAVKQPVKLIEEVVSCEPAGTYGYFDPAIEKSGGVTLKSSDIYSFGVVLFELLCGRTSYIDDANDLLAPLAKHHYENETLKDIVNPQVWKQIVSPKSLIKYSEIAYTCLKEEPTHRPDIRYIVDELEEALELQQLREHHNGKVLLMLGHRFPTLAILDITGSTLASEFDLDLPLETIPSACWISN
ncbi:hypothetical protein QVD17_20000 [Tagetes erecta]|uniref:Protein kinase domain-containing protein n=1 Tax=Tagetes erecta TaxID=13708 RepID=A0AAD8NXT0_TARER|nr:hypothetical protein QVD17_20000 [Tagetes erecta]